eukprot:COSAG01_NODE_28982_length_648_cov_0.832423_2_plen_27_part_01
MCNVYGEPATQQMGVNDNKGRTHKLKQ